tara:strand:- start:1096 stop:1470 length:375 start_codon:yes stop_codon:yes gene_type:complete
MKKDYRELNGAPLEVVMNSTKLHKSKKWKDLIKKLERIITENVARTELDTEDRKEYPYTKKDMRFKIPGIIVYDDEGYTEILWADHNAYETNPDVLDDLLVQVQNMMDLDTPSSNNIVPFKGRD